MRKPQTSACVVALLAVLMLVGATPANAEPTAVARYRIADASVSQFATVTEPSTQVFMTSRSTGHQYWDLDPTLGSSTTIVSAGTGQCVTAATDPAGARPIVTAACDGSPDQQWTLYPGQQLPGVFFRLTDTSYCAEMVWFQQPPNYRLYAEPCAYPLGYRPQTFRLVT